jgi:DNA-directed RNA polymerase subunit N (RpoN/RPB10)
MTVPTVCTCGLPLDLLLYYWRCRADRMAELLGDILPEHRVACGTDMIVGDILDTLGVTSNCCRIMYMTSYPISDLLNMPNFGSGESAKRLTADVEEKET